MPTERAYPAQPSEPMLCASIFFAFARAFREFAATAHAILRWLRLATPKLRAPTAQPPRTADLLADPTRALSEATLRDGGNQAVTGAPARRARSLGSCLEFDWIDHPDLWTLHLVTRDQVECLPMLPGVLLTNALKGKRSDEQAELLDLLARTRTLEERADSQRQEAFVVAERAEQQAQPQDESDLASRIAAPATVVAIGNPMALVRLDDSVRSALQAKLAGENVGTRAAGERSGRHDALEALREDLGDVPLHLETRDDVLSLLRQIELVLAEPAKWAHLTRRGKRILLEAIAARAREIQSVSGRTSSFAASDHVPARTRRILRCLRVHAGDNDLDRAARGLARADKSLTGSWLKDARAAQQELDDEVGLANSESVDGTRASNVDDAFRRLRDDIDRLPNDAVCDRVRELLASHVPVLDKRFVKLLEPRLGAIAKDAALAQVARGIASALAADDTDDEAPSSLPADWYGFKFTAGKNAVIVGGDPRTERLLAIQTAFRFASLVWPNVPKGSPRKAAKLVGDVRKGKYQFVICLQPLISHKLTESLFPLSVSGRTVVLARGYGTQQIRAALERYLPREPPVESSSKEIRRSAARLSVGGRRILPSQGRTAKNAIRPAAGI